MKRAQSIGLGIAAVGLIGAGLAWWQLRPAVENAADKVGPDVAKTQRSAGELPLTRAQAQAGSAYTARYNFQMEGGSFAERVDSDLQGKLEVGVPQLVGADTWLPARLVDAKLQLNPAARKVFAMPEGQGDQGQAELGQRWALRVRGDGRLEEVRFAAQTSAVTQGTLAALAQGLQLVGPTQAGAATWQLEERDANGPYRASYARQSDGAVLKTWTQQSAGFSSTHEVRFTLADGQIQAVHAEQKGTAATSSLVAGKETRFGVVIDLQRQGSSDGRWASGLDPATLLPYRLDQLALRKRAPTPAKPLESAMREVTARASSTDTAGRMQLRGDLTRAIAASPEASRAVAQSLRQGTLQGPARTVAIAALVGARTPEAQREVADLVKDTALPEELRINVLQSASLMTSPTLEFAAALAQLAYTGADLGYSGAVATTLGATLGFLRETHPEQAKKSLADYADHAKKHVQGEPSSELAPVGVRIAWLAGLGNTADPQALPLILAGLKDPNELVRGSAALALRFQEPKACIAAMHQLMASDQSIHVRENLVDAARDMGPAAAGSLVEKALFYDKSELVRKAAAYTLATWSHEAPGLRAVLVTALKAEKSARVAEALKNYIEPGRIAGSPAAAPHHPEAKP